MLAALALQWLAFAPATFADEPTKVALVVGVNKYHRRGLAESPLDYAEADAKDLGAELETLGFAVTKLLGDQATKEAIDAAIVRLLAKRKSTDIVLIGLAGHGNQDLLLDEEGRPLKGPGGKALEDVLYCPVDAVRNAPKTMISLDALMRTLDDQGGINLVLVDACRDLPPSPFRGTSRAFSGDELNGRLPQNTALLFSCSARQKAFETNRAGGGHGVFFWHVLEGLRGAAAIPGTGEIKWDRLASYVTDNVDDKAREWFPDHAKGVLELQTPHELRNLRKMPVLGRLKSLSIEGTLAGQVRDDNLLKMPMVWCPPGSFTMGSPEGEKDRDEDAEKQVKVTFDRGFWIGKYEFRQSDYKALMGAEPSRFKGPNLPVETVDWNDAQKVGLTLTQRERAAGRLPIDWEYRLPTEAEWEYACRAGTTTATAFGDSLGSAQANFNGNCPYNGAKKGPDLAKTAEVGRYPGNGWGLHDMHGNVWEWCLDGYQANLPGGVNPVVSATGAADRVIRGGHWINSGRICRSASRRINGAIYWYFDVGFRVARVPAKPNK